MMSVLAMSFFVVPVLLGIQGIKTTPQFAPSSLKASKVVIAILADNGIKSVGDMKTPLANHVILSDGTFITNPTAMGKKVLGAKVTSAYSIPAKDPVAAANKAHDRLLKAGFRSKVIPSPDKKAAFLTSVAFGDGGWMMVFFVPEP